MWQCIRKIWSEIIFLNLCDSGRWILTSRLPGSVHRHLHTLGVDGDLRGGGADQDVQVETLPSPAATNKPQIVELGHVVLHHGRVVPQFPTEVLVVPRPEGDHGAVVDLAEGDHLEGRGEGLVAPPVGWESGAENIGSSCLDQLPGMLGQDLTHLSLCPPPLWRVHGGALVILHGDRDGASRGLKFSSGHDDTQSVISLSGGLDWGTGM